MNEFFINKVDLINNLGVDPNTGLTDEQVRENTTKYGSNVLARVKSESLLKRIWNSATEPMLLPVRKLVDRSPLGGPGLILDFSPIIAMIVLMLMRTFALSMIYSVILF